jgi:hypothetical protein
MTEYEHKLRMHVDPDAIFDFVADVRNLPKYLPTTHHAEPQGQDRVKVEGEAHEHHYDSDGFLRADRKNRRLEWGADEGYYSGWLEVRRLDGVSEVTVHLSLTGAPPGTDSNKGVPDAEIADGLLAGLRSIQNHVEGRGGKEEPPAAT